MTDTNNMETKTLEARCYCGGVHFTVDVPTSSLPLPIHLCHCSQCRYRSGAPCVFHTTLPASVVASRRFVSPSTEANMTAYDFEGVENSWMFCSTCGCHVTSIERRTWVVATSIFTDHGRENFRIAKHIFSQSTGDGGLAGVLTAGGGSVDGCVLEDRNPPEGDPAAEIVVPEAEVDERSGEPRLRARCHCGGVSFTIGRPERETLDEPLLRRFVSPLDEGKWFATLDACADCRLVNGTHLIGWLFAPSTSLSPHVDRDLRIGTAKTYSTSPGVLRSFCGRCGATVFFTSAEREEPGGTRVLDVATGILRAPGGAMAEDWLTWRTRVAWKESGAAFDDGFMAALVEGMKAWTVQRYGQEFHQDIG